MNETAQQAHPFPRSVEALEETLKRAHDAKIAAFAVITVDPNGIINWKWHFGPRPQTDLIGGITCMQQVIVANAMSAPPPQPPAPAPDVQAPTTETRQ